MYVKDTHKHLRYYTMRHDATDRMNNDDETMMDGDS